MGGVARLNERYKNLTQRVCVSRNPTLEYSDSTLKKIVGSFPHTHSHRRTRAATRPPQALAPGPH
jgi:hypothetical protein